MSSPSIIFISGVSGSGKTTIGKLLAQKTGLPFFDADDFHSETNKEKMKRGQPLTDDDRIDWLTKMNGIAKNKMKAGGAIIACSALKEKYRLILSQGIKVPVSWIFLQGDFDLISQRMLARPGHFMPVSLLHSQFEILEIPTGAMMVDISKNPQEIVDAIVPQLK